MAKEIELHEKPFYTYWRNSEERGCIDVDVYLEERTETSVPVIEWTYPKIAGNSILGNASFWLGQAVLQASAENG